MQSFTKRCSIFLSTIYHFYFVSLFMLHASIVYDDDFCVAYNYLSDNRKLVAKVVFSTFVAKWPIFRCISKTCFGKKLKRPDNSVAEFCLISTRKDQNVAKFLKIMFFLWLFSLIVGEYKKFMIFLLYL